MPDCGELVPVLVFGEEHLLHAAVGSKHGYEDVGVRSCILSVTGDHRHLINHLNNQNMSPSIYTQRADHT